MASQQRTGKSRKAQRPQTGEKDRICKACSVPPQLFQNRTNWAKVLIEVDSSKSGGFALVGPWINNDSPAPRPGSYVVFHGYCHHDDHYGAMLATRIYYVNKHGHYVWTGFHRVGFFKEHNAEVVDACHKLVMQGYDVDQFAKEQDQLPINYRPTTPQAVPATEPKDVTDNLIAIDAFAQHVGAVLRGEPDLWEDIKAYMRKSGNNADDIQAHLLDLLCQHRWA
jgi:hypothetical protein